jgi:D-glycero-alpha-D-manno-heptose-7-phosphate kinase
MIITQTPLRVGLVGGGTDLPSFYREHGGRVLNAAIDKYVYVVVKQRFDDDIYVNYSQKEIVSRVEDLRHDLVREAMQMAGVRHGVEITTLADIPSAGSGLGSSSSVTVGLLQALFAYQGIQLSASELAERACAIELERCGKPIGKQDQYAAAFGGICDLRFGPGDRVGVEQIHLQPALYRYLQGELMLFYSGITRSADAILEEQTANVAAKLAQLALLRDLAEGAAEALRHGETDEVGVALNKSWAVKRELASGVSNTLLDAAVDAAVDAGATGAKVAGAGGGGFVLAICPVQYQAAVRAALPQMKELPIKIDPHGSRVVFNVHRDIWG